MCQEFPYEFEEKRRLLAEEEIQAATDQSKQLLAHGNNPQTERKDPIMAFGIILILAGIACFTLDPVLALIIGYREGLLRGIFIWLVIIGVVLYILIGGILGITSLISYVFTGRSSDTDKVKAEGKRSLEKLEIEKETRKQLENEITKIKAKAESDCKQYFDLFQETARRESVKYANSSFVKSVLSWIIYDYSSGIKVQRVINTPFSFGIYSDRIVCKYGTYDLFSHKQQTFDRPVEQAAFARAVAMGMMGLITVKSEYNDVVANFEPNVSYVYKDSAAFATVDNPLNDW